MKRLPAHLRRESILKAALTVISKNGYAGLTTARVARNARVSEPILYRHFPSKEAMLRTLLDEVIQRMMAAFHELIKDEADPATALFHICHEYPKLAQRYQSEFRVINQALVHTTDQKTLKMLRNHYNAYHAFLQKLIEKGQQTGAFRRDVSAKIGAWHIVHAALGFLVMKDIGANVSLKNEFEDLIDITLGGLKKAYEGFCS